MQQKQIFGGDWTEEKLKRIKKYLTAYTTILNKQPPLQFAYIDAFAGTGYRDLRQEQNPTELMFPELMEADSQQFLKGSAYIALQTQPRFTKYIFIEKDETRFEELKQLRTDFPHLAKDIALYNQDCNTWLQERCLNYNWSKHRALLFLDPFGMQVQWKTIEAISKTKAIDMWLLFPLGVAVNRLLKRNGDIDEILRGKLDLLFGTTDWFDAFYQPKTTQNLFGSETRLEKVGSWEQIGNYFVERLKTIFAGVAENPLPLYNSRHVPLYLLCFAAGNPKGAKTAVKIAQDILGK